MTAINRAQQVLDSIVGSAVSKAKGAKVLDAYENAFKDHLPSREMVTGQRIVTEATETEAEVTEDVRGMVQYLPGELSNEQSAEHFLDVQKRIIKKLVRQQAEVIERASQKVSSEAAITAAGDAADNI